MLHLNRKSKIQTHKIEKRQNFSVLISKLFFHSILSVLYGIALDERKTLEEGNALDQQRDQNVPDPGISWCNKKTPDNIRTKLMLK